MATNSNIDPVALELGDRVVDALHEENRGNRYKRQHNVSARAFDALVAAALGGDLEPSKPESI